MDRTCIVAEPRCGVYANLALNCRRRAFRSLHLFPRSRRMWCFTTARGDGPPCSRMLRNPISLRLRTTLLHRLAGTRKAPPALTQARVPTVLKAANSRACFVRYRSILPATLLRHSRSPRQRWHRRLCRRAESMRPIRQPVQQPIQRQSSHHRRRSKSSFGRPHLRHPKRPEALRSLGALRPGRRRLPLSRRLLRTPRILPACLHPPRKVLRRSFSRLPGLPRPRPTCTFPLQRPRPPRRGASRRSSAASSLATSRENPQSLPEQGLRRRSPL